MESDSVYDIIGNLLQTKQRGNVCIGSVGPQINVAISILPDDLASEIDSLVEKTWEKPHNNRLVGRIKKEYSIPTDSVSDLFKQYLMYNANGLLERDSKIFMQYGCPDALKNSLYLDEMWVNFQEKYEYNPPHTHAGLYSFVIWNKIPYDLEEEARVFPDTADGPMSNSSFSFIHPVNDMVHTLNIPVSKEMQNFMCVFPSNLTHCVHPFFTSDSYRVSLSGNIKIA